MKVLDSDFLIAILRKDADIKAKLDSFVASDKIVTTVFNAQEVLFGASISFNTTHNRQAAKQLLESLNVLDYSLNCVERTVNIKKFLMKIGKPIGMFDEMIAAICLENNAEIVTRNTSHFKVVPDLKVETW